MNPTAQPHQPNANPASQSPARSRVLGVIPARLASTRLPRKVLREIAGQPLLAWVFRAAQACPGLDALVVATDSPEIQNLCDRHNWRCLLTSPDLPSGTDRLHAVSQQPPWDDFAIYVNIQGDEPLLQPAHIAALLAPFTAAEPSAAAEHSAAAEEIAVTTLKVRCAPEEIANPNAVKVVTAADGRALYFSRATIPFDREQSHPIYFKHLGLYAYRRAALQRFASLPPGELEQIERLEQLRLLENNIALYVTETAHDTIGVDTEDDLRRVEAILLQQHSDPRRS